MKVKIWLTAVIAAASLVSMPATASAISISAGNLTTTTATYGDTSAEFVQLTDVDGNNDNATAFLLLELAGNASSNSFGIYGFADTSSGIVLGDTLEVFGGAAGPVSAQVISFDLAHGKAWIGAGSKVNIGSNFGFYISGPGGTFYSHASLNTDGQVDHARLFQVNGDVEAFGSDVVVGFEDLAGGGDLDFDDMVVGVNDVTAVPEPGSMMLLGTGLFGLAGAARRRFRRS